MTFRRDRAVITLMQRVTTDSARDQEPVVISRHATMRGAQRALRAWRDEMRRLHGDRHFVAAYLATAGGEEISEEE